MIGGPAEVARRTQILMEETPPREYRPDRVTLRWERHVDPDGLLDPRTRRRKADQAMKRYLKKMAKRSAEVRRKK